MKRMMKRWRRTCLLGVAVGLLALLCACAPGDHEHTAASMTVTKAPTCTAEGEATGRCVLCGEDMMISLDRIPHTYAVTVVDPTCEAAGYTRYACACGDTYDDAHIPAKGHDLMSTVIAPVCEKEGYTHSACACGYTLDTDFTPPTGHTFTETVTPPTCEIGGHTTYTCDCGYTYDSDTTAPTGHTFTETVAPPTCEAGGHTTYTCDCGYTYDSDTTAPTGHTFTETVTLPTCEVGGFTTYTCDCGYTYDSDATTPTGHTFTETVTSPTCEEGGFTTYTCDCGYTYDSDATAPTGHTFTETVTPPTCEEGGFTTYTCACGYTYDSLFVPPTGHTLTETVTPPTCGEEGFTHYACEVCDYEADGNPVAPLAHANIRREVVYATVSHPGYTLHVCDDCGYSYEDGHVLYEDVVSGAYVENTEILAQGIDTSKWNHAVNAAGDPLPLDFEALKAAGVDFVILKAGSTNGIDPAFEQDYLAAKAAGLSVGAYFYAYSTTVEDTLRDAELLLGWLEGKQFEYPIYFDVEDAVFDGMGKDALTELCVTFLERLQEAGYYAALYTNNEWLYNRLDTTLIKSSFDVWYARYVSDTSDGSSSFTLEDTDFPWRDGTSSMPGETDKRYGLWQYTSCGRVEGFNLPFDFNYAFKDYASLMVAFGLNGFSAE